MNFDTLSKKVIGAALKVHSALGQGLFEEVYKVDDVRFNTAHLRRGIVRVVN